MRNRQDQVRERAIGLFRFLKEFSQLRTRTIKTLNSYEEVLFFSDIPAEEGCFSVARHRKDEPGDEDVAETWIEVRKPNLPPHPVPAKKLAAWLDPTQMADSSLEMPDLKDRIEVSVARDDDEQPYFEALELKDQPEISEAFTEYVEKKWWPWAEEHRRRRRVQRIYTELFSIHKKQQSLGEQFEVIVGFGLLRWLTPKGQEVNRHIVAASVSLAFDPARGVMTVGPAGDGANAIMEQGMLHPTLRPDPSETKELEHQIGDLGDDLWQPGGLDEVLKAWVHSVSASGTYSDSLEPPQGLSKVPVVHFAPALILRQRGERSYVKAFQSIIEQLENGRDVPCGVATFVSVVEEAEGHKSDPGERHEAGTELFLPLLSNEQQRDIVRRISRHEGVLVQGPPGTGKSHTIVNLICHLLATGQSVLVTSHTARALKVLQGFLRQKLPRIAPLAVVLLGNDREALQAMEDSVQGITDRYHRWDAAANERKAEAAANKLCSTREQDARIMADLRATREQETFKHPRKFETYAGTLKEIAEQLNQEEERFGWLKDRPSEDIDPPLSDAEITELSQLLREEDLDKWHHEGFRRVPIGALPSIELIRSLVEDEAEAQRQFAASSRVRTRPEYRPLRNASANLRQEVVDHLSTVHAIADRVQRHFHDWTETAVTEILGDHDRAWRELWTKTSEALRRLGDQPAAADKFRVSGLSDRRLEDVLADAEILHQHVRSGGRWGFGPIRPRLVKERLYLRREIRIAGHPCDTAETLGKLVLWLTLKQELMGLQELWAPYFKVNKPTFGGMAADFEDLCEPLEDALAIHATKGKLVETLRGIPDLPEPIWHDIPQLRKLLETAQTVSGELNFEQSQALVGDQIDALSKLAHVKGADPSLARMLAALRNRDLAGFEARSAEARQRRQTADRFQRRSELKKRLAPAAPRLAAAITTSCEEADWIQKVAQFGKAWNWAQTRGWIQRVTDPDQERRLQLQLDRCRKDQRRAIQRLAELHAWRHCFQRMTNRERQSLVAWAKAVRRIGRGTGKYAPKHRRTARKHMNDCRSAIPAWIMPLYRVAETIKPGTDAFDVAIIDEASQSGPEALLLSFLARKIVVVGDDKQISPTYAGINHEDVERLRQQHIRDLPHNDAFGVDQSFFDLADIRFPDRVRLREHFRCMPEIIQFSNQLCYQSEPLLPLRQFGSGRLSPVIKTAFVPGGFTDEGKGNRVEAEALVEQLVDLDNDPKYKDKTFGVISLLGGRQIRTIEELLLERLGPKRMEDRQLVCGDAYAFQGDERDVMFLSMVSAPNRRIGALTSEPAKRRFNVAASRARDQMFLFHSVAETDLSPRCLRRQLLQYCLHPNVHQEHVGDLPVETIRHEAFSEDRQLVRPQHPFGSWFEVDVFLKIVDRGFRVLPQHEVAGYRIDLLVLGLWGRLAVECDGDEWHGVEQYEADVARQRTLERCGLKFWRVRSSVFTLNPDAALESLWKTLELMEINSSAEESAASSYSVSPPAARPSPPSKVTADTAPAHQPSELMSTKSPSADPSRVVDLSGQPPGPPAHLNPTVTPENVDPVRPPDIDFQRAADSEKTVRGRTKVRRARFPTLDEALPNVPDPAEARPIDLVPVIEALASHQGPLTTPHLYRLVTTAGGRKRVGKHIRRTLNQALAVALRRGLVVQRRETERLGYKGSVIRSPDSAEIVIRERGKRQLSEIPASEVAAVMQQVEEREPYLEQEELFRATLHFYGGRKLTNRVKKQLGWVRESQDALLMDAEIESLSDTLSRSPGNT